MKRIYALIGVLFGLCFVCGCEKFVFHDVDEEYYSINQSDDKIVVDFSPSNAKDVNVQLLYPIESDNIDSNREYKGRVRFCIPNDHDSAFLFRKYIYLGHTDKRYTKYCNFGGVITVYNLSDTSKIVLPGMCPFEGNSYSEYVWTVKAVSDGDIIYNHFLLYINDTLLSQMEKDYDMLKEFPEFYGQ